MTILSCDFLTFHGLQLDFKDILLVELHVIGWHHEHVVHGSRFDETERRPQPQHSGDEVDLYQSLAILTFSQLSKPQRLIMMWGGGGGH